MPLKFFLLRLSLHVWYLGFINAKTQIASARCIFEHWPHYSSTVTTHLPIHTGKAVK